MSDADNPALKRYRIRWNSSLSSPPFPPDTARRVAGYSRDAIVEHEGFVASLRLFGLRQHFAGAVPLPCLPRFPTSPSREHRCKSAIAAAAPTADKITGCIRAFVQVAEAVTNTILGHSGRGMLVPVPQFNAFDGLTNPLAPPHQGRQFMDACWGRFAKERNEFLEGIETALIYQDVSDEARGAL